MGHKSEIFFYFNKLGSLDHIRQCNKIMFCCRSVVIRFAVGAHISTYRTYNISLLLLNVRSGSLDATLWAINGRGIWYTEAL